MGFDRTELASPNALFAGSESGQHHYFESNGIASATSGKIAMRESVKQLVLEYAQDDGDSLRFMSLPGKYWRFEFDLAYSFEKSRRRPVYFTGFERDHNTMLAGAGYAPRYAGKFQRQFILRSCFHRIDGLGVDYFKTNRARWLHLDVNAALTLNNACFHGEFDTYHKRTGGQSWMEWWLKKFCAWDAVWLDYYGPVSTKMGAALANLYFHCRNAVTPIAVTVLKGRELPGESVPDRKAWLCSRLASGIGTKFECLNYHEHTETEGATMCNLIGLLTCK